MNAIHTTRTCPACGAANPDAAAQCAACDERFEPDEPPAGPDDPLVVPGARIRWPWVGIGLVILLLLHAAVIAGLAPALVCRFVLDVWPPNPWAVTGLLLLASSGVYFVGAGLIARLAASGSSREAVLAAATAAGAMLWAAHDGAHRSGDLGLAIDVVCSVWIVVSAAWGATIGSSLAERSRRSRAPGAVADKV